MSVDGKEQWIENRAYELFDEMQRKNPHLSFNEIDELCFKQAEEDYMNQPEANYDDWYDDEEIDDNEEDLNDEESKNK
jgi:hypothetical protein